MILGMKTRKQDLEDMLKFNPKILEFHFSDSDLNLELEGNFEQKLIVHCFEYFERKLLDIVSLKETNQVHSKEKSLELIQKAIDKTLSLSEQFQGTPTLIVHPGGYSLNESTSSEINKMKGMIVNSVQELDFKNVNFLLENMPKSYYLAPQKVKLYLPYRSHMLLLNYQTSFWKYLPITG